MKIFLILLCWSHVHLTQPFAAQYSCTGPEGQSVREGTAWVAPDGCNRCTCTQFGVECTTWMNCQHLGMLGHPGDPLCVYGTAHYTVGKTWTAEDGCNKCLCTARGMNCTAQACANTGFASPKSQGEWTMAQFMDCRYKDKVYRYGDQFLADDGCNTCLCIMPGNAATFPVCTTTPCDIFVVG
ncbi:cysteine-rich motor neuron 1 protein-like [Pomacea canaliculata]|uniref:cysteine-rich motor neuron 1 protein-like n=1 Tax=Pomacea canaliculata TaxID=400727 RepID=UPI000D73B38C|nr:cysteine-rich motor neuron 1 protein-like [Pomacea canaliculata]